MGSGRSRNCTEGKQQHDCPSVSPDVEALSWLSVPSVPLFRFHRASLLSSESVRGAVLFTPSIWLFFFFSPQSRTDEHSIKINNYHSVTASALSCFTHRSQEACHYPDIRGFCCNSLTSRKQEHTDSLLFLRSQFPRLETALCSAAGREENTTYGWWWVSIRLYVHL